MKNYLSFINEDAKFYKIGDEVTVNGSVDDRDFVDQQGTISDICVTTIRTDMKENGKCPPYYYKGQCYLIKELDWWVSPFNLSTLKEFKQIDPLKDPYGEEQWDLEEDEITEAISSRSMDVLVSMQNKGKLNSLYDIWNSIDTRDDGVKRTYIANLFEKAKGKKVHFTNFRDGKNTKKERIIKGVYWDEMKEFHPANNINGHTFYLIGTKKSYVVNIYNPIGYYTNGNSVNNVPEKPKEKIVWFSHGKLDGEWN
jgi:hypothetical protein